jgi:hypothetical protein
MDKKYKRKEREALPAWSSYSYRIDIAPSL